MRFPFFKQQDVMDCGPTCLRTICAFYGKQVSVQKLRKLCSVNKTGASLLDVSEAAEQIGFRTTSLRLTSEQIKNADLPCIIHWKQNHFVVLYRAGKRFVIADPAIGIVKLDEKTFTNSWYGHQRGKSGVALFIEPTPAFYLQDDDQPVVKLNWRFIFQYFRKFKQLFAQLILGLGLGTILSLIMPFLTQSIVDVGINTRNISFVYLVLIAQTMLFLGTASVDFIRSWILLQISTRVNISILTDFLIKLMKLPLSFYETKTTGDILQRMSDQQRIESFLTSTTLSVVFSFLNLVLFTIVLLFYNPVIFFVSLFSTVIYTIWIMLFLERRRQLNYKQFDLASDNQTMIVELVNALPEIKLNNIEQQKRWEWEHLQARLFKFKVKVLSLTQYQQGGAIFINQAKNIIITFLSIKAVIDGQITIGGMMAIQYIAGQVNSPVEQLLSFVQSFQDAKISLERLNEIHELPDEETKNQLFQILPADKGITFENVQFTYPGAGNDQVLCGIDLHIPEGKTTAIVGVSGSGKTTLIKMLLRFHQPEKGAIYVGKSKMNDLSFKSWRSACGTVMQEGFIFSDTVEKNIVLETGTTDTIKLQNAIRSANLQDFVDHLPLGLHTRLGATGNGISQGQKQRLLIARAIYKDPDYLFFDEATNALDAKNEREILQNLKHFLTGKTVVVVAHRLSTVTHADKVIVVEKGRIVEQGTHQELIARQGAYFDLVKNQLELEL